jgi:predicted GNAT family N-acyltransferase
VLEYELSTRLRYMSETIATGQAQDFSDTEREEFRRLVKEGGEVPDVILRRNIQRAKRLVFMRNSEALIGTAALKIPELSYRERVGRKSGVEIPESRFPFELGYVVVAPSEREKGHSRTLVEAALNSTMTAAIYATSRVDNIWMHRTLEKFEFGKAGAPYTVDDHRLQLFLREPTS